MLSPTSTVFLAFFGSVRVESRCYPIEVVRLLTSHRCHRLKRFGQIRTRRIGDTFHLLAVFCQAFLLNVVIELQQYVNVLIHLLQDGQTEEVLLHGRRRGGATSQDEPAKGS